MKLRQYCNSIKHAQIMDANLKTFYFLLAIPH